MNRIREIREAHNITQKELADRVGISCPFLCDLEKNRRGAKPETLDRIAKCLGVSAGELVL